MYPASPLPVHAVAHTRLNGCEWRGLGTSNSRNFFRLPLDLQRDRVVRDDSLKNV